LHKQRAQKYADQFANKGYRTLVFAMRDLSGVLASENEVNYISQDSIEKDFEILGITGMEDLLQEEVNECMRDFKDAGIKVWMLTGDKGETAH
jgi:magnesium-transporting ATPase (P-type)